MTDKKGITVKKEEDFSEWYTQLVEQAELADVRYGVKGFVVYREWSQHSMEKMFRIMSDTLDRKGHMPVGFPAVIPEKNFLLEKEHVEGFQPEVFWLEGKDEKLALRPTSETAFHQMYSLWIRSHRDLPFKRYQRANIFRNEKTKSTRPFLRGREFHWIETHCAFASEKDARKQVEEDMETTQEILYERFGIPHIFFERPQWDKFPGAECTFAADALMGSGKVLQLPSTHLLGENFSKPFNIKYQAEDGSEKYCHLTCYGPAISRIYGGMISLHSDNKGLRVPFELAPLQIAIIPVKHESNKDIVEKAKEIESKLRKNYSVKVDERLDVTPGYKFNEYELKGVPIRIEIGPKDLEKESVMIARRDTREKESVSINNLEKYVEKSAESYTFNLIKQAEQSFEESIENCETKEEIKKALKMNKIARINLSSIGKDIEKDALALEEEIGAEIRGSKLEEEKPFGKCILTGKEAAKVAYIAKSY